jgi:hypothetical protein
VKSAGVGVLSIIKLKIAQRNNEITLQLFGITGIRLNVIIQFAVSYRLEEETTCQNTPCLWPTCPSALFTIPLSLADN